MGQFGTFGPMSGFLFFLTLAQSLAHPPYYSALGVETEFNFDSYVEINRVLTEQDQVSHAVTEVKKQVQFIIGPMFHGYFGQPASAPYEGFQIQIRRVEPAGTSRTRIYYSYLGKAVISNQLESEVKIYMPVNVEHAIAELKQNCGMSTDHWYDWIPGTCGLVTENNHYLVVRVPVAKRANTTQTYPEFEKLADKNGVIQIEYFIGSNKNQSPKLHDEFKYQFGSFKSWVTNRGFTPVPLTKEDKKLNLLIARFEKKVVFYTFKVVVYYGNVASYGDSSSFQKAYLRALRESSVVMYSGHAGLGKNLNLELLEKKTGAKPVFRDGYQLMLLDVCLGYTYYAEQYIHAKPQGSLDLITTGLEAYLTGRAESVFEMIYNWASLGNADHSYQALLQRHPEFLFSVLGDEDNTIR